MSGLHTGITVGLPFCGRPTTSWWGVCLATMDWPGGIDINYRPVYGQEVGVARNVIAEQALQAGDKYILFIDDDTGPPRWAAKKLIRVLDAQKDVVVCGGIYTTKSDMPEPMAYRHFRGGSSWDWQVGETFEVEGLATGCMMIRTELFSRLPKPWFKTIDDRDTENKTGGSWTDDLYFCNQVVQAKAGKIIAHGGVLPWHYDVKQDRFLGWPANATTNEPKVLTMLEAICGADVVQLQAPPSLPKTPEQERQEFASKLRDHRPSLYRALRKIGQENHPETYLEIGVQEGTSLESLLSMHQPKKLVLADSWEREYGGTGRGDHTHIENLLRRIGYQGEVTFLNGQSQQTIPQYFSNGHSGEQFDLILVDGDHSVEGATIDFHNCWPLLRRGGLMLADDVGSSYYPGLGEAFKSFLSQAGGEFLWEETDDVAGVACGRKL